MMSLVRAMSMSVFVLAVLVFASAGHARKITIDPYAKVVSEQKEDNKRWEKEAKATDAEWGKIAEEYYKQKEFRKARDYYRKIIDLRYKQWDFPDKDGGRQLPARDKDWYKLRTSHGRRARTRLKQMEQTINTERLNKLMEEAEVATVLEEPLKAYRIYDDVLDEVDDIGREKYAISYYKKAKDHQKKLMKGPSSALDEIKKLLEKKEVETAEEKLKAFEEQYGDFLQVSSELRQRFEGLGGKPAFVEKAKERQISRRLLLGDKALANKDYGAAYRHYSAVVANYKGTEGQKTAAKKLAEMLADPNIKDAVSKQEVDEQAQLLVYRARGFLRMGRIEEARGNCEKVIIDFPESKWAKEAVRILEEIDRQGAAKPREGEPEKNKDAE